MSQLTYADSLGDGDMISPHVRATSRRFASLYSHGGKMYAIATDGTAWLWSSPLKAWVQLVPLPQEKTDG